MPRIATLLLKPSLVVITRLGTKPFRSTGLTTFDWSSCALVTAVIASGAFWILTERFCATTTISSSPELAAGAAAAGWSCAMLGLRAGRQRTEAVASKRVTNWGYFRADIHLSCRGHFLSSLHQHHPKPATSCFQLG